MTCPFCHRPTASLPAHYSSDDCPALVDALGAVTAAGRAREADTRYHPDSTERARQEMDEHPARATGRRRARVMGKIRA